MKFYITTLFGVVLLHIAFHAHALANSEILSSNKKAVVSFYNMAFNQHKPTEAMKTFVGEKYIQHNPFVSNGQKPFIEYR